MLVILSPVIYDHKHGHVLLILMGKIRIDGREFTPSKAARYLLRIVLGSCVYAPTITDFTPHESFSQTR